MLKYILSIVLENMRVAEAKHSTILALNSGLIVITVGFFSSADIWVIILNWLVVLFASISILYCFLGLFARHIKEIEKEPHSQNINLLYFKDIAKFKEEEYLKCIIMQYNFPQDYKTDGFEFDLAKQIIVNSKIANMKYLNFNKSVVFLAIALFLDVVLMGAIGLFL